MHALVVTVQIDSANDPEEGRKHLRENVVPAVSKAPGFLSGYWLAPDSRGRAVSFVIFDNEDNVKAGAGMAQQMFDSGGVPAGVTLSSIDVREVSRWLRPRARVRPRRSPRQQSRRTGRFQAV